MSEILEFRYEVEGHFDKDEQGWCSSMHQLHIEGDLATWTRWHDANGVIRVHQVFTGEVISRGKRVLRLRFPNGERSLNLSTGRLSGGW